ncbi:Ig-like domain-containing protein [Niallia sp. NCCP-28]|uniref:S8 family peptidase n=1 Tax=Niallia sp. NCCP-28 TaxID=2934712 RepID=UPI00207FA8DD|nr:Ig-like domain-containing protein [Niallia sp. NCCP-28]GKU84775.1 cell wall-associated protease [Niallia sp. NCCP-28]
MKKRKITSLFAILLAFAFVFNSATAGTAFAADTADKAENLTAGQTKTASFNSDEYVKWFKITPTQDTIKKFTHLEFILKSKQEMNVSIYSSLENAKLGNLFDQYTGYSYDQAPAVIDFPLAWNGTYYVKVEYYSDEDIIIEEGEVNEIIQTTAEEKADSSFTLQAKGATLAPSTEISEECPVELSTKDKKDGQSILSDLRTIRDSILSQTANGKELSSLYYKVAPFLSAKMVFDKELRSNTLADLRQLKPIFAELLNNGTTSTYTFTNKDVKAINRLYESALAASPKTLKEQIQKIEKKINIGNLEDKTLASVFSKLGASTKAITNKNAAGKYIVKLKEGKSLSSFKTSAKSLKSDTIQELDQTDKITDQLIVMDLGKEIKTKSFSVKEKTSLVNSIKNNPAVEFVEPVKTYKALSTTQDVSNSYQWSLKNSGQTNGNKDADIQYENLYKLQKAIKPKETLIAVVDTGVDSTLADLKNTVKIQNGYNYISNTQDATDDNGHGTHVSGIIAASVDNNYSIAGINTSAKILPVKVLDASGAGDNEQIAKGIKFAVDKGAKVINLSLGGDYSRVLEYMLQYANKRNVTVIAASGNESSSMLSYPASSQYVTSVGATNDLDLVSDYSNYGESLDLVAPGTNIPSLVPNGNITYYSGTSMAAPHVAAVAGLMLSINPNLKPKDVENALISTTKNVAFTETDGYVEEESSYLDLLDYEDGETGTLAPGYDLVSAWGRLNAFSAVSSVKLNAKVNTVYNSSKTIRGTAEKGTAVSVKIGKTTKKAAADSKGNFKIEIPVQKTDSLLYLTFEKTINGIKTNTTIRTAVQKDTKAPNAPKINPVADKDTKITGTTEEYATITVKTNGKTLKTGTANANGVFSIAISKQKAGTKLTITAADGAKNTSKATSVTVIDKTAPGAPSVTGTISDISDKITGKAEANSTITIKNGKTKVAAGKTNSKGSYSLTIKKQKAGTKLSITATDKAGNISKIKTITIADKTAPNAPKVNAVTTNSTTVTGKAEANAVISIKVKNKELAKGTADSKGSYSIKITKQKAETVLSVTAKDKAGNISKATKKTVAKAK